MYTEFKALVGVLICFLLAGLLLIGGIIYGCATLGDEYYEYIPDEPAYPVYYRTFSAQEGHALAITEEGTIIGWGSNADGQLGHPGRAFHQPFIWVADLNAVAVFGWRDFGGAIDRSGDVFVWGGNWEGRLAPPNRMPIQLTELENVKYIWVNNNRMTVLTRCGRTYIRTADGELEPLDLNVSTIAAGATYMLFLTIDGEVYGVGDNSLGQLGATVGANSATVVPLGIGNVRAIAAGTMNAHAVTNDGYVYQWGQIMGFTDHDDGESVEFEVVRTPQRLGYVDDIVEIASGNRFTIAVNSRGNVWGWGINELGVLGDYAENIDIAYPRILDGFYNILDVSASGTHFLALQGGDELFPELGTIFGMGHIFGGEIGSGNNVPTVITGSIKLGE